MGRSADAGGHGLDALEGGIDVALEGFAGEFERLVEIGAVGYFPLEGADIERVVVGDIAGAAQAMGQVGVGGKLRLELAGDQLGEGFVEAPILKDGGTNSIGAKADGGFFPDLERGIGRPMGRVLPFL